MRDPYDKTEYHAPCGYGLGEVLADEVRQLGGDVTEVTNAGVTFHGDLFLGYRANLWLRTAIRVQQVITRDRVRDERDLYDFVRTVRWIHYMKPEQTLAVDAAVSGSRITHSHYAALKVKDAIVDQFRDRFGKRPNVDRHDPDLPLQLHLRGDTATIYRNLSGRPLHKRGWQDAQVKSPLNESLAAGLLLLTGWDRQSPVVDPMCGSATFLIEAALMASNRPPGGQRSFAFERWTDFEPRYWRKMRREASENTKPSLPFKITGGDGHPGAIQLARRSAKRAHVDELVDLDRTAIQDFEPAESPRLVVVNPPYGKRLDGGEENEEELQGTWRALGSFLHDRCIGADAFVLCGNKLLTRFLGLRASARHIVRNGPIDCRWIQYEIHAKDAASPQE